MSDNMTPRDRALAGEVVKVTDERLAEMQRIAIDNEDAGTYSLHWHWAAAITELIAARKEIERLTRDNRAMRGLLAEGPDSDDLVNARLARIKSGEDK